MAKKMTTSKKVGATKKMVEVNKKPELGKMSYNQEMATMRNNAKSTPMMAPMMKDMMNKKGM